MNTETVEAVKAPFPWFGGKSKAASLIWERLGTDIGNYIEPFFGSGAVYHARPKEFDGWATINDADGHLVNFWRSVTLSPDETAKHACNPVFEADLHARHLALVNQKDALANRLMGDPEYHEPKLAGWWAWGACCWIGRGWCSGNGSWGIGEDAEGFPIIQHGIRGVNRQLPHLGGGTGVNRQLPHLGNGGETAERLAWVQKWFRDIQDSMRSARVACGDWERICSIGTMTRNGMAGVLFDPPYSQTAPVYAHDGNTIANNVRAWCIENGDNKDLRIALCGHDGEHNELESLGWSVETWDKGVGYQGADDRERIWFSPHCKKPRQEAQTWLFD